MPGIIETQVSPFATGSIVSKKTVPEFTPLKLSGALNQFASFENTPCIGTEFRNVSLAEWVTSPESDTLLRDLAVLSEAVVLAYLKLS